MSAPLPYCLAVGETFEGMRENVRKSPLYQRGDMRLVWFNEGDLNAYPAMADRIAALEAERDELRAACQAMIAAAADAYPQRALDDAEDMIRAALAKSTPDTLATRFEIEATRMEDDA